MDGLKEVLNTAIKDNLLKSIIFYNLYMFVFVIWNSFNEAIRITAA